jgi:hypothetical protein
MGDTVRVETDDKKPWWDFLYSDQGSFWDAERRRDQDAPIEAPTQERPEVWGAPAVGQFFDEVGQGVKRSIFNAADFVNAFFRGEKPDVWAGDYAFPQTVGPQPAVPGDIPAPIVPGDPRWDADEWRRQQGLIAEEPASRTLADMLAGHQFDSSPYDNYMNFLMEQDEETMARINAMYSQLADSAEGNMQRVADVYDSARIQSGDVFGGSAQNIEDAYGSASQQAADQMARLGIEAAAPGVLDPMALSQAEAVSGVERAGAGSLDALTRYGASAQDFGGQMAQVGQQQGLEVSNQILRDMQQRQAEAAFMREQARADFNPYQRAMQEMQAQQMFDQMQGGQDPMEMLEQMRIAQDRTLTLQDRFIGLAQYYADLDVKTSGKVNTNPGETPEERARMMLDLVGSDDFGYPMPMF